ncbi:hypothetical protein [Martelella mangrovi]|uniref:Nucleotide-diphospho-sugar transferase domain-containing protein n=1 Tax=Martelella mangrovi TaxID=1397477 RepID=A0ABV2IFF9_9HYPH
MKVISYYTLDTPYAAEVRALEASLRMHGLDYAIEGLPARASWVENCAQKSAFVRDMAQKFDEDLWWLDADAELCGSLPDLGREGVDIAAYATDGWSLNSGTVFFANTDGARRVIDLWCSYCETCPFVWDQLLLMIAVHNVRCDGDLVFRDLPETYYKRTKSRPMKRLKHQLFMALGFEKRPVVRQNQASRRFKSSAQTKGKMREFSSDDAPADVRAALRNRSSEKISMEELLRGSVFDLSREETLCAE